MNVYFLLQVLTGFLFCINLFYFTASCLLLIKQTIYASKKKLVTHKFTVEKGGARRKNLDWLHDGRLRAGAKREGIAMED